VAGARLATQPVDLAKQANIYRSENGWFGNPRRSLKDLPIGEQTFAGVRFNVYEFPTSPVPTAVALKAKGLPDGLPEAVEVPVNRKADALFLLHTARLDQHRNQKEIKENKQFVMARYTVTWADGRSEDIPVVAEVDIDHWVQKRPAALPGAQLAWSGTYAGSDESAAVWSKQWTNPRPEVEIRSIGLAYGPDRRGVPVLLAVTAATVVGDGKSQDF
jgi:beta-galactosidase